MEIHLAKIIAGVYIETIGLGHQDAVVISLDYEDT